MVISSTKTKSSKGSWHFYVSITEIINDPSIFIYISDKVQYATGKGWTLISNTSV